MKTALIIDDNRQTADSVNDMLRFLGLEPTVAYGPRDGMIVLKDMKPDIVFLDINMPGLDGFEVMGYLRRFPQLEHTPVVYITSDDQPETAQKARKTGALLLVVKPVTLEALEMTLRKAGLA
jgi:CheY-like chemotaxis protein